MGTRIIYGAAAVALALSTAAALAQTKQTGPVGQYDQGSAQTLTPSSNQYNQGSAQTLTPSSNQYNQGSAQTLTPSSSQYNQGSAAAPQKSQ
jgi:hypothetical protein